MNWGLLIIELLKWNTPCEICLQYTKINGFQTSKIFKHSSLNLFIILFRKLYFEIEILFYFAIEFPIRNGCFELENKYKFIYFIHAQLYQIENVIQKCKQFHRWSRHFVCLMFNVYVQYIRTNFRFMKYFHWNYCRESCCF